MEAENLRIIIALLLGLVGGLVISILLLVTVLQAWLRSRDHNLHID